MTGLEAAGAAAVVGWLVAKFKKPIDRAVRVADDSVDALLNRLHSLVLQKLGKDPALEKLESEARTKDTVGDRTSKRVELALDDAMEENPEFKASLYEIVAELQKKNSTDRAELTAGRDFIQNTGNGNMIFHSGTGNVNVNRAQGGE